MISVINSDTKSVLEKLKVSQTGGDQFGNYTCFANNSMGSVSAVVSYSGNVMYIMLVLTRVSVLVTVTLAITVSLPTCHYHVHEAIDIDRKIGG